MSMDSTAARTKEPPNFLKGAYGAAVSDQGHGPQGTKYSLQDKFVVYFSLS